MTDEVVWNSDNLMHYFLSKKHKERNKGEKKKKEQISFELAECVQIH